MTPETIRTIVICVAVVTLLYFAIRALQRVATRTVEAPKEIVEAGGDAVRKNIEAVGKEIRELLGAAPEITVNRTVIQQAPQGICELYFFKQPTETREELVSKKLGSSKHLVVSQKFVVKAGFDLNRLRLHFDQEKGTAEAMLGGALLISVENEGPFEVEKSESGLWNWITQEEKDQLVNSLPLKARSDVETATVRQLAAAGLKEVLTRICERGNIQLTITDGDVGDGVRDSKSLSGLPILAIDQLGLLDDGRHDKGQSDA